MCLYSPPRTPCQGDIISHLISMEDHIGSTHQDSSLMIVRNSNDLDVGVFVRHLGWSQMAKQHNHNNHTFDMIFTDRPKLLVEKKL